VRATRQGAAVRAVLAVLAESTSFRSAQDLHAQLRQRGQPVGLTTVYGTCRPSPTPAPSTCCTPRRGRRSTGSHHHHLVCRSCGLTVEIEGREVEQWGRRVADAQGFVDVDHTIEVFGTCASCADAVR